MLRLAGVWRNVLKSCVWRASDGRLAQCFEITRQAPCFKIRRQAQHFKIFRQAQFSDFRNVASDGRLAQCFEITCQAQCFKIFRQAQFSVTMRQTCIMSGIVYFCYPNRNLTLLDTALYAPQPGTFSYPTNCRIFSMLFCLSSTENGSIAPHLW